MTSQSNCDSFMLLKSLNIFSPHQAQQKDFHHVVRKSVADASYETLFLSFFFFFACVWQSPGCDEFLGSDKVLDKCGVCGGDNTACRLVSGLFQHSLSKVGYHKIVEIPQGATKINVTEMVKSQNYLGEWRFTHTHTRAEPNSPHSGVKKTETVLLI